MTYDKPDGPTVASLAIRLWRAPLVRLVLLSCYYLAILVGLVVMYGRGDFSNPSFVYQGF